MQTLYTDWLKFRRKLTELTVTFTLQGESEFIGRALAMPTVKLTDQAYEAPFFPPVLQWFQIYRGQEKAGELLAAFELLQVWPCTCISTEQNPESIYLPGGTWLMDGRGCAVEILQTHPLIISRVYTQTLYYD